MTILALEFSSDQRSVALARGGKVLAEAAETGGRGTNAFALIEKVLATAKVTREEIEAMAVGLGPGSYTGIRAAIAVAQGWQLARGIKLIGVSSVEAMAAQAQAAKIFGRVNVVVDAQRGEFYLGIYDLTETTRTEVAPLKIVAGTEISSLEHSGERVVGLRADKELFPAAAMIAQLATWQMDFVAGEKLEPIYLRETTFVKAAPARLPSA